jgi:hypothetical protein
VDWTDLAQTKDCWWPREHGNEPYDPKEISSLLTQNQNMHDFHYNLVFNAVFTIAGSAIMMTVLATII